MAVFGIRRMYILLNVDRTGGHRYYIIIQIFDWEQNRIMETVIYQGGVFGVRALTGRVAGPYLEGFDGPIT